MAEVRELGSSVAQGLKVACEAGRNLAGTRVLRDAVDPTHLGARVDEAERLVKVASRAVDEVLGLLEDLDPCGSLLGEVLGSVAEEVEGLVSAEGQSLKEVGSENEGLCSLATATVWYFLSRSTGHRKPWMQSRERAFTPRFPAAAHLVHNPDGQRQGTSSIKNISDC